MSTGMLNTWSWFYSGPDLDKILLCYLLIINIISFIIYGLDKLFAVKHKWRISEASLLGLAAVGGSIGALAGMYTFRHKTRKVRFFLGVPFIIILQLAAGFYICRAIWG